MTTMAMNSEQILSLLQSQFPQAAAMGLKIDALEESFIRVRLPTDDQHLRPGGTLSGPTMMMLADTAMYFLVLAHIGPQPLTVTTSLNINFLKKPVPGDLVAQARMLKLGARLAVGDVLMHSTAVPTDIVAQAAVTYSIPPPSDRQA